MLLLMPGFSDACLRREILAFWGGDGLENRVMLLLERKRNASGQDGGYHDTSEN